MTALPLSRTALASLADLAGSLAREAGGVVHRLREEGVEIADTKSSLADVVTAADRESERMLAAALREARPDDGLLGEEGASRESSSGITWVIDPIDGTVNYLYGLPAYGVSIAATVAADRDANDDSVQGSGRGSAPASSAMADGRRAIAGAVYVPATGELFTARAGGGAFLNGRPIKVSQQDELQLSLVATGFGYTVERRTEQAEVVRRLIPRVRDIRRMGAASVDLCYLAAGRLDAYYERGLQPWDYAAGALIAREAGAAILALDDDSLPGEPMLIAAAPSLARELQEALREAYAALPAG